MPGITRELYSLIWGKFDEALKCLEKSLKIAPEYLEALENKGLLFLKMGKYNQAIETFDRVLEIDSKNESAIINKGIAYNKLGKNF